MKNNEIRETYKVIEKKKNKMKIKNSLENIFKIEITRYNI